ncbi:hypothetical protein AB0H12_06665 [Actinosynnema sp. NPDC023794]
MLIELVEPVRRGSARPLDPDRSRPVHAHPRSLGAPRPAGLPVPDAPPNVGVRVVGAEPAGRGGHVPRTDGDVAGQPQALASAAVASPTGFCTRRVA